MVEAPKFEYKYDLALWKSFSARLSVTILVIAAGVFLIAMLTYLYFSEESVKENSAVKARTQLHDAVMTMRIQTAEAAVKGDTMGMKDYVSILQTVKPYKHAITLMTDRSGQLVYVGDSVLLMNQRDEVPGILKIMGSGEAGLQEVFKHADISLLIHEPVGESGYSAGLICSRKDILSGYLPLVFYGGVAFIGGLLVLFSCCAFAIHRLVKP